MKFYKIAKNLLQFWKNDGIIVLWLRDKHKIKNLKKIKKFFKNLLTNPNKCDIIITEREKENS